MSGFGLSPEQERLKDAALTFAASSRAGNMIASDRDAWKRRAEFGVLGMLIRQKFGATDVELTSLLAVREGTAVFDEPRSQEK